MAITELDRNGTFGRYRHTLHGEVRNVPSHGLDGKVVGALLLCGWVWGVFLFLGWGLIHAAHLPFS